MKDFFAKSCEPKNVLGDFRNGADVEMPEKRFLSGEERVFSSKEK